jgi:hypothetical protein
MTDQPDKLDLRSHDMAEDRRQELLRLFPEIRTEGGKIDFERLKLVLGETVDVGKERYGMTCRARPIVSRRFNPPVSARCARALRKASTSTPPRTSSSRATIWRC